MRKLSLLAAAAMVASGSAFAMDGGGVFISGEANFGVKYNEANDVPGKNALAFHHEFDIKFSASGTTDGGIGFGAKVTIDNTESVSVGKTAAKPANRAFTVTPGAIFTGGDGEFTVGSGTGAPTIVGTEASAEDALGTNRFARPSSLKDGDLFVVLNKRPVHVPSGDIKEENGWLAVNTAGVAVTFKSYVFGDGQTTLERGVWYTAKQAELLDDLSDDVKELITPAIYNTSDGDDDGERRDELVAALGALEGIGDDAADEATAGDVADAILALDTAITAGGTNIRLANIGPSTALVGYEGTGTPAGFDPDASNKVDNHAEVYISMDMHKLTLGSDIDAADKKQAGGLADPGFDGIGIDDVAEAVWGSTAADARYDGDFGVASVSVSVGIDGEDTEWAAGFSFNVDPVKVGAGFDSHGVMSVGMGFSQGQISMNALYSTDSDWHEADNEAVAKTGPKENTAATGTLTKPVMSNAPDLKNQAMGIDIHYQMSDATSLVIVAAQHKQEGATAYLNKDKLAVGDPADGGDVEAKWVTSETKKDAFGVGFSHDLGGGATLKAGAGSVDSDAVADLGITMKF